MEIQMFWPKCICQHQPKGEVHFTFISRGAYCLSNIHNCDNGNSQDTCTYLVSKNLTFTGNRKYVSITPQ